MEDSKKPKTDGASPIDAFEMIAAQQAEARAIQEDAAMRGIRPSELRVGEHGSVVGSKLTGGSIRAPRVSDFYLIDTTMTPEDFIALVNKEVLGNYDVRQHQGEAEFGLMVMRHDNAVPTDEALSSGDQSVPVKTKQMILAKFDAGPWEWYDRASMSIMSGIIGRVDRRGWRCGWAIEKQWSWVEHWRPHRTTGKPTLTETIDGPANATVTGQAMMRWGINVRAAFDDLMRAAQWEALRQWMVHPEPRPSVAHVSFLAGKLLISEKDKEWIPLKWAQLFPGRKPEDGPLHLQAYYEPTEDLRKLAPSNEKAPSSRTEPPSLGLESGERF